MNLSPFVISNIRTLVPVAVGALLTWLASTLKIAIDPNSQAGLVVLAVGVLSGGYYALVHLLEQKWPKIGVLLGVDKVPVYATPPPSGLSVGDAILAPEPTPVAPAAVPPAA